MMPYWIKRPVLRDDVFEFMRERLAGVNTVCQSARCPNIGECFSQGRVTFLILGPVCSRRCGFCAVPLTNRKNGVNSIFLSCVPDKSYLGVIRKNRIDPIFHPEDRNEVGRIVESVRRLNLRHIVITSVTRDDLPDGGASTFAEAIRALRALEQNLSLEVLVPDFQGRRESVETVLSAGPDIFAHNIETVPRLYSQVRMGADYNRSLGVLRLAAGQERGQSHFFQGHGSKNDSDPFLEVKSGIMLGLGEYEDEVLGVFRDLRNAGVESLTVGQYLRPTKGNLPVVEYIHPDKFAALKDRAIELGFSQVESGPFVRSSQMRPQLMERTK